MQASPRAQSEYVTQEEAGVQTPDSGAVPSGQEPPTSGALHAASIDTANHRATAARTPRRLEDWGISTDRLIFATLQLRCSLPSARASRARDPSRLSSRPPRT